MKNKKYWVYLYPKYDRDQESVRRLIEHHVREYEEQTRKSTDDNLRELVVGLAHNIFVMLHRAVYFFDPHSNDVLLTLVKKVEEKLKEYKSQTMFNEKKAIIVAVALAQTLLKYLRQLQQLYVEVEKKEKEKEERQQKEKLEEKKEEEMQKSQQTCELPRKEEQSREASQKKEQQTCELPQKEQQQTCGVPEKREQQVCELPQKEQQTCELPQRQVCELPWREEQAPQRKEQTCETSQKEEQQTCKLQQPQKESQQSCEIGQRESQKTCELSQEKKQQSCETQQKEGQKSCELPQREEQTQQKTCGEPQRKEQTCDSQQTCGGQQRKEQTCERQQTCGLPQEREDQQKGGQPHETSETTRDQFRKFFVVRLRRDELIKEECRSGKPAEGNEGGQAVSTATSHSSATQDAPRIERPKRDEKPKDDAVRDRGKYQESDESGGSLSYEKEVQEGKGAGSSKAEQIKSAEKRGAGGGRGDAKEQDVQKSERNTAEQRGEAAKTQETGAERKPSPSEQDVVEQSKASVESRDVDSRERPPRSEQSGAMRSGELSKSQSGQKEETTASRQSGETEVPTEDQNVGERRETLSSERSGVKQGGKPAEEEERAAYGHSGESRQGVEAAESRDGQEEETSRQRGEERQSKEAAESRDASQTEEGEVSKQGGEVERNLKRNEPGGDESPGKQKQLESEKQEERRIQQQEGVGELKQREELKERSQKGVEETDTQNVRREGGDGGTPKEVAVKKDRRKKSKFETKLEELLMGRMKNELKQQINELVETVADTIVREIENIDTVFSLIGYDYSPGDATRIVMKLESLGSLSPVIISAMKNAKQLAFELAVEKKPERLGVYSGYKLTKKMRDIVPREFALDDDIFEAKYLSNSLLGKERLLPVIPDIVFVIDSSGSMGDSYKFESALTVAYTAFLSIRKAKNNVFISYFNVRLRRFWRIKTARDFLNSIVFFGGGTNIDAALFEVASRPEVKEGSVIFLITDADASPIKYDTIQKIREKNLKLYVMVLGGGFITRQLCEIAHETGGRCAVAYSTRDLFDALKEIYRGRR